MITEGNDAGGVVLGSRAQLWEAFPPCLMGLLIAVDYCRFGTGITAVVS